MTNELFPVATVALMALCFMLTALLGAFALGRWRPSLAADTPADTAWVDGLRGLAATFVVMNHVPLVVSNHLQLGLTIDPEAMHLANYLGVVGVQLFFCITGYLFAGKILGSENVDWTDFFVRRIRRLVPAYAVAVLAALVVASMAVGNGLDYWISAVAAVPHMMSFGVFLLPNVEGFDMGRLLGVNWTLAIEWRFYAVLPLLFALRRFGHMRGPLSLLVFTLLLMPLLGAGIWLYFIVGAAATFLSKFRWSLAWRPPLAMVAVASLASMAINWESLAHLRPLQGLHVAALFFCLCVLRPRLLTLRTARVMGAISYSFYLLHMLVLFSLFGFVHHVVVDITDLGAVGFTVLGSAGVALSVAAAALSYALVEQRFMARRKATAIPAPAALWQSRIGSRASSR